MPPLVLSYSHKQTHNPSHQRPVPCRTESLVCCITENSIHLLCLGTLFNCLCVSSCSLVRGVFKISSEKVSSLGSRLFKGNCQHANSAHSSHTADFTSTNATVHRHTPPTRAARPGVVILNGCSPCTTVLYRYFIRNPHSGQNKMILYYILYLRQSHKDIKTQVLKLFHHHSTKRSEASDVDICWFSVSSIFMVYLVCSMVETDIPDETYPSTILYIFRHFLE